MFHSKQGRNNKSQFPQLPALYSITPQMGHRIIVVILTQVCDHPTMPCSSRQWHISHSASGLGPQSLASLSHLLANLRQPRHWMAKSILRHNQLYYLIVTCYACTKVFCLFLLLQCLFPKLSIVGFSQSVSPAVGTTHTAQSKHLQDKHPSHPMLVLTPWSLPLPPLEQFSTT